MPFTLDPRCEFGVLAGPAEPGAEHEDLGCGLQGPASRAVRRALDPLRRRIEALGRQEALLQAAELVEWAEYQPAFDALCTTTVVKGRRQLKASVLYPKDQETPRVLHVRRGATGDDYRALDWPVPPDEWPALHDLLAKISEGASEEEVRRHAKEAGQTELIDELAQAGWLANREDDSVSPDAHQAGLWFVGHNTAIVASDQTRLVVDPWFRPWRDADPADFKPLRRCDLGRVDAIAITHTHGDHFHLGSLLHFARDTPIFVPRVERPSILATNLEALLAAIGFTHVRSLAWWETATIGDLELQAMPFRGEQAGTIELVDPELRNVGNTWIVRSPGVSAAFIADTGRDPSGSMLEVGLEARRRFGKVDVLFGGMRGFALAPLFLPFTTLDAMFVNVPIELLAVRQRLMNDAIDLLATAEVFGASHVVPYADGGAPWYWREGMGPTYAGYPEYPGEKAAATGDVDDPDSAPFPERLVALAQARYGESPLVMPLVLRPGDLVRWSEEGPQVGQIEGFAWPYADAQF